MTKTHAGLIASANHAVISELRGGSKETCTMPNKDNVACTVKLYKQAQGAKRDNSLIATVSGHLSNEINYVSALDLSDDSLVVFEVNVHNVADSAGLGGLLANSNGRQTRIKDIVLIAMDSKQAYIVGNEGETHDISLYGQVIGAKWIKGRILRLLKKGKRQQWKQVKTIVADKAVYTFDFDLD